ncbi:MAG: DUF4123 domain-containing protein [Pseudomonadota bacterium]
MEMYFAVDELPPAFMADLLEAFRLARSSNANLSLYALIDASFDYVRPGSGRKAWKDAAVSLYDGTALDALSKESPHLFAFSDEPAAARVQMHGMLARASGMPMISFIASELNLDALAQTFKAFLEINTADGQSFLLRFADTRVLPVLDSVLRDECGDLWRKGVAYWWLPGRDGNLHTMPAHHWSGDQEDRADNTVVLSQDAFNRVVSEGDADAILDVIADQNPEVLSQARPSENYCAIRRLVPKMAELGVESFPDAVVFCTTALLTTENFHLHRDFNALLANKKWVPGKLGEALFEVDDASWEEIEAVKIYHDKVY